MPAQTRTFWISLTLLALVLAWREWPGDQPTESIAIKPVDLKPAAYPRLTVDQGPVVGNFNQLRQELGYPQMAYDAGIQGEVRIRVQYDREGRYKGHQVIDSFHPLLRMASEAYVSRLRITPLPRFDAELSNELTFSFEIPDYGK